jgi:hypothetical protein
MRPAKALPPESESPQAAAVPLFASLVFLGRGTTEGRAPHDGGASGLLPRGAVQRGGDEVVQVRLHPSTFILRTGAVLPCLFVLLGFMLTAKEPPS